MAAVTSVPSALTKEPPVEFAQAMASLVRPVGLSLTASRLRLPAAKPEPSHRGGD
jgi:hypothetical protein